MLGRILSRLVEFLMDGDNYWRDPRYLFYTLCCTWDEVLLSRALSVLPKEEQLGWLQQAWDREWAVYQRGIDG